MLGQPREPSPSPALQYGRSERPRLVAQPPALPSQPGSYLSAGGRPRALGRQRRPGGLGTGRRADGLLALFFFSSPPFLSFLKEKESSELSDFFFF